MYVEELELWWTLFHTTSQKSGFYVVSVVVVVRI